MAHKQLNLTMTEEQMSALIESTDPGKRNEFIRMAIEWQIAAKNAVRQAIEARAAELGFAHPSDVFKMISTSEVEIAVADGKITGFEDALSELAKSKRLAMGKPATTRADYQGPDKFPPVKVRL